MFNTKWSATILGAWISREVHPVKCTCSYCRKFTGKFGIALPQNKGSGSWRILWWRYKNQLHVLRSTLPKYYWPKIWSRKKLLTTAPCCSGDDTPTCQNTGTSA